MSEFYKVWDQRRGNRLHREQNNSTALTSDVDLESL